MVAYYDYAKKMREKHLTINPLEPREIVYKPATYTRDGKMKEQEVRYELFLLPSDGPACFYHISKARCSALGREWVQHFVNQFQLKTYRYDDDKAYPYCTHELFKTFLYGWFPLSYLPGCPKFEQLF